MKFELPYPIKKELLVGSRRILLLQKPFKIIYNRNLVCLNEQEELIWQISDLNEWPGGAKDCPFIDIEVFDNQIKAWNWCSLCFMIDPETGNILGKEETR